MDDVPTLDVFTAETEPYPFGMHYRRIIDPLRHNAWTAREYFDIYAALPTDCDWVRRPAQTAQRAADFLTAETERFGRFPGSGIARYLRYMIDARAKLAPNADGKCRP